MNTPNEKKTRIPVLDWLLYFGSQDERVRRAADRSGHLAFQVVFFGIFVDFVYRTASCSGGLVQAFPSVTGDLLILLVGSAVYYVEWFRRGVTFLDSPRQRRAFWLAAPLTALMAFVVSLVTQPSGTDLAKASGTAAVTAVLAAVLVLGALKVLEGVIRRRTETGKVETDD